MNYRLNFLFAFLFLSVGFGHAQNGPINVHLKSGEVISTNYVYLTNSRAFSRAFARIDSKQGRKITIDDVDHVEGKDQHGAYRFFRTMGVRGGMFWAERGFVSDRMEMYYIPTNEFGGKYKSKFFYYSKDGEPLQQMNFRNVKRDVADDPVAMAYVKKAGGIRTVQYLLYAAGAGLVIAGMADDLSKQEGMEKETALPFPPMMIAGVVCLYAPWLMHGSKMKNLDKALQVYK